MARLRDTRTGVVVDVDDDTAARLGSAYEPVKATGQAQTKPPARKAPAKSTAKK